MIHNPPGAMDEAHNFCFSKSSHRVSLNCACAFAIFQSQIIDSFTRNLWYTYPPWNDIQSSKPCEITEEPREMQCIHQECLKVICTSRMKYFEVLPLYIFGA